MEWPSMVKYRSIYVCHTDEHVLMAGRHPELYLYNAFSKTKTPTVLENAAVSHNTFTREVPLPDLGRASAYFYSLSLISCLIKINPANKERLKAKFSLSTA
jgi:hypothetical protein